MTLSKEEKEIKVLGQEAKGFLEGNLYQAMSHHLSDKLGEEYPKPVGEEWQDKYRYARAYEAASSDMVNFLIGLKNQYLTLLEKEKHKEESIEDA